MVFTAERRPFGAADQILVFKPPQTKDGETGVPIVSDLDITATDGNTFTITMHASGIFTLA